MDIVKKHLKSKYFWRIASLLIVIAYSFAIFCHAVTDKTNFSEVDSNVLPVISLQYRGSTTCNQSDIDQARIDFPRLYYYQNVESYDDLRGSKLIRTDDDTWVPWYFPVYPATCIPVKLILSSLGMNQELTFPITNALFVLAALLFVMFALKRSWRTRFLVLLFLCASPIYFYITYINYEVFMFSFIAMSSVCFVNGRRRVSAVLLSIAGMANQAVMIAGLVMIVYYIVRIFFDYIRENGKLGISIVKQNILYAVTYAACFLPCMIPSVWKRVLGVGYLIESAIRFDYSGERFWAYLTDLNLGVASFGAAQLILAIIILIFLVKKKEFSSLAMFFCFLAALYGVSIGISNINCGMIYCARYVAWAYVFLAFFLGVNIERLFAERIRAVIVSVCAAVLSISVIAVNAANWDVAADRAFNFVSSQILDYFPSFYAPIKSTFVTRVSHVAVSSDEYDSLSVTYYYTSSSGKQYSNVRKILFRACEEQIAKIKDDLTGTDESVKWLSDKLDSYGLDGSYHYINIGRFSEYQLHEKTLEEREGLVEGEEKIDATGIELEYADGSYYEFSQLIRVKKDTVYKISVSLPETMRNDNFMMDFFLPDYDNNEQQASNFAKENVEDYTFFWNTGDFGSEKMDVWFRCIYYCGESGLDLAIEYLGVTEMKEETR